MVTATLLTFAACWLFASSGMSGRASRVFAVRGDTASVPTAEPTRGRVARAGPRTVLCVSSGAAVGLVLVGPLATPLGGLAGAVASYYIGRLEPAAVRREREQVEADLPLAVDLLASCTAAGRSVDHSLLLVADAVGGPLARHFRLVAQRLALGGDSAVQWRQLAGRPEFRQLGKAMARSAESGAPVSDVLHRLGDDRRRERRWRNEQRARAVGVQAAGPLAACFLPAFMLVGVVPTIAGAIRHLGL